MPPGALAHPEQAALLTGLAVCGFCGQPLRAERRSARQVTYRCPAGPGRAHLRRSAPRVDAWVRLLVLDHLDRPGAPAVLVDPDLADLHALRAHSAGLRTRLRQLTETAGVGGVDRAAAAAGTEMVAGELTAVEVEMTQHVTHPLPASLTGADPVEAAWDRLGADRQRTVLRQLAERIALHPVLPGRRAGDPDVLRGTVEVTWTAP